MEIKEIVETILKNNGADLLDDPSGHFVETFDDGEIDFSHLAEHEEKFSETSGKFSPICSFAIMGGVNGSGEWADYFEALKNICEQLEDKTGKQVVIHKVLNDIMDDSWIAYVLLFNTEHDLEEAVEIHDKLNPKIWNEDKGLIPEVRAKILQIVDEFKRLLALDNVELKVADIYLLGSNANYNYNADSDLDIHIIADETFDCSNEHLPIIYNAYKTLFNKKYNLSIKGINAEIYVENKDKLSNVSSGVYSLNNGWIKEPARYEIPEIDQLAIDRKVQFWEDKYYQVIENPSIEKVDKYLDDIYELRQNSIQSEGEFGEGNLVFKEIRRLGYLDELRDLKTDLVSKDLSLESLEEAKGRKVKYTYVGPLYIKTNKIAANWEDETYAVSQDQAINTLRFKAREKLGLNGIDLIRDLVRPEAPKVNFEKPPVIDKPKNCPKCGRLLTTAGECPVCDLGDESALEEAKVEDGESELNLYERLKKQLELKENSVTYPHTFERNDLSIDYLISLVDAIYDKVASLKKPAKQTTGGEYYGSTPLYRKRDNVLEILTSYDHKGGYYEGNHFYEDCYAVKIGGAYSYEDYKEEVSRLKEIFSQDTKGYDTIIIGDTSCRLIDHYGSAYSVYGVEFIKK